MRGRITFGFLLIGLLPALAACGGGESSTTATTDTVPTTTTTTTAPPETTSFRVYFLKNGKVQPVASEVAKTQAVARAALDALLGGPATLARELGMTTGIDPGATVKSVTITDEVASIVLDGTYDRAGLAQLVYTLTQFPTVKAVEIDGKRYARSDFEDETPIILVESPLPFQTVTSPLRATGTANTFEATFNYDLVDSNGKVIATNFVTATSGTGQRGTFDFSVPFTLDRSGDGKLIVYELSAKDGSRIHEVEIPVRVDR